MRQQKQRERRQCDDGSRDHSDEGPEAKGWVSLQRPEKAKKHKLANMQFLVVIVLIVVCLYLC